MTSLMPQTVVDRIFAFMLTEKTGHIDLHFRGGQLLNVKVIESLRIGADDRDSQRLDSSESLAQELEQ